MTAAAQSGLPADPLRGRFRLRSLCAAMSKTYYHFQSDLSGQAFATQRHVNLSPKLKYFNLFALT